MGHGAMAMGPWDVPWGGCRDLPGAWAWCGRSCAAISGKPEAKQHHGHRRLSDHTGRSRSRSRQPPGARCVPLGVATQQRKRKKKGERGVCWLASDFSQLDRDQSGATNDKRRRLNRRSPNPRPEAQWPCMWPSTPPTPPGHPKHTMALSFVRFVLLFLIDQ